MKAKQSDARSVADEPNIRKIEKSHGIHKNDFFPAENSPVTKITASRKPTLKNHLACWKAYKTRVYSISALALVLAILAHTLPFLIIRHVFQLELLCFNDDVQNPQFECETRNQTGMILMEVWKFGIFSTAFLFSLTLTGNPDGSRYHFHLKLWIITTATYCMLLPFIDSRSTSFAIPLFYIFLPVASVFFDPHPNRGGIKLFWIVFPVMTLTWFFFQALAPYVNKEIIAGVQFSFFVPLLVQINQSVLLLVGELLSAECNLNASTRDSFLAFAKMTQVCLSTLKLSILAYVIHHDENPSPVLVFSVLLDSFGRTQFCRGFCRNVKYRYLGGSRPRPLKALTVMFLCSEFDTNYIPLIVLALMKICRSPILNSQSAIHYVLNSYMDIKDGTVVDVLWQEVFILLLCLALGDFFTYALSKKPRCLKLYDPQLVLFKNPFLAGLCSLHCVNASFLWFLHYGYLFSEEEGK